MTADNLILEEKKNLQPEKKQLSIMQESYVYCDIRFETYLNVCCTVIKFKTCSRYIDTVPA